MKLSTISQVSKAFAISTRALRYYEELGLIESQRIDDYAYRVYDETAIKRLKFIVILRKLCLPLKQIDTILKSDDFDELIAVFQQNIDKMDNQVAALNQIRTTLRMILAMILQDFNTDTLLARFSDPVLLDLVDSTPPSGINFKEEISMEKPSSPLTKLNDVRIIWLAPATVAASHFFGPDPEQHSADLLEKFVNDSHLYEIKPDARVFGFNHPNPSFHSPEYGYETWVTIPDEMEVTAPLTKKQFPGGLYAAHTIVLGDFHEWEWLSEWVNNDNPKYGSACLDDNGACMYGLLEEHLNWLYNCHANWPSNSEHQLDLLYPVSLKK